MSTEVTYNGVHLSFVKTQDLGCKPVMDPSGTDQTLNRFDYSCAAVITDDPRTGETAAQQYGRIRHLLTQPRKALLITSGGKVLLQSAGLDSANGPQPLPGVDLVRVTDTTFAVTWGVTVHLTDCDTRPGYSPVLSLRWTQTHDLDEHNMSVFVTTGRLIAASDLLRGLPIDVLRPLCVPDEPPNCVRKSKYTVQADGLAIDFTFTDTEQYLVPEKDMAAAGVVKVGGTYEKIVLGGVVRFIRLALRMEARKTTPKRKLMAMAAGMALARLRAGRPAGGKVFIKEGAFREHLGENVVEIQINAFAANQAAMAAAGFMFALGQGMASGGVAAAQALLNPENQNAAGKGPPGQGLLAAQIGLGLDAFGIRLPGCGDPVDEVPGIAPDLRGNYDRLLMIAAALRDPCLAAMPPPANTLEMDAHLKTPNLPGRNKLQTPADGRLKTPTLAAEDTGTRPPASVQLVSALPVAYSFQLTGYTDPYCGIYTEYETTLSYGNDRGGREVLPATVSGALAVPTQTHNDLITLEATWTATKVGGTPTVPSWKEAADGNAVCTLVVVQPEMVDVAADGVSLKHTITGCYHYAFLDSSKVQLHSPLPPWTTLTTDKLPGYPTDESIVFGDPTTSTLHSR